MLYMIGCENFDLERQEDWQPVGILLVFVLEKSQIDIICYIMNGIGWDTGSRAVLVMVKTDGSSHQI